MSGCISIHGEYSDHIPDEMHTCTRCSVLDEDALREELKLLRATCSTIVDGMSAVLGDDLMPHGTLADRAAFGVGRLVGEHLRLRAELSQAKSDRERTVAVHTQAYNELSRAGAKRDESETQRAVQLAELGASNASLIRRVADLESQLAEANDRAEAANAQLRYASRELVIHRTEMAIVEAAKAWRELVRTRGTVYALDSRAADLIAAVDAYDAAGKGETDDETGDAAASLAVTSRGLADAWDSEQVEKIAHLKCGAIVAERDELKALLDRERRQAAAGYRLVSAAHFDWLRRVEAALVIADAEDVTDWQRGWRACVDRVRGALTPDPVDVAASGRTSDEDGPGVGACICERISCLKLNDNCPVHRDEVYDWAPAEAGDSRAGQAGGED